MEIFAYLHDFFPLQIDVKASILQKKYSDLSKVTQW